MSAGQARRAELEYSDAMAVGPGIAPGPGDCVPLVPLAEAGAVRWAGYDTAMADAAAHRDQALAAASDRLGRAMQAAYTEWERDLQRADASFAAARRAAMNARELARQAAP